MSFLGLSFIIFLIIFFAVYFIIPLKYRWIVLLAASIVFYCTWGFPALIYILFSVIVTWYAGWLIENIHNTWNDDPKSEKRRCRVVLYWAVSINLGILIVTKALRFSGVSVIVPLGISYYTLSLVGYLADVYWKKEKAEKNVFRLMLFAVFFPKILQGPISKHRNLAAQLNTGHKFDYRAFTYGVQLMLWGYVKKMVIADRLNLFVSEVFGNFDEYSGSLLLVGAVFGAFQLYCDFSGCMDIARGICEALGIELERNFNHPFFSESAAEFWRRWHITLGAWFKDYIYMPLVISPRLIKAANVLKKKFGKRAGKAFMSVIPLAVVWIFTGLWHGTGLNYIVWGCYWGIIIIISTVFEPEIKRLDKALHIKTDGYAWHLFRMIRTFALFVVSRIITIPGNIETTKTVFAKIFTDFETWKLVDGSLYTVALDRPNFILAVVSIMLLAAVSGYEEKKGSLRDAISSQWIGIRWCIYYVLFFTVIIFGIYGSGYDASAFVYMQY